MEPDFVGLALRAQYFRTFSHLISVSDIWKQLIVLM
jgi:hypothetical protein